MKKLFISILTLVLALTMIGCSNKNEKSASSEKKTESIEESSNKSEKNSKVLVAYFTYGENVNLPDNVDASSSASIQVWDNKITGNVGVLANIISEEIGADTFSIKTVEKYSGTYDEVVNQGQQENVEKARPNLSTHIENLDEYETIFIGFPNWWYDMPMAMYSFFDEYDFSGKNIVLFSSSGGSGFSDTVETIKGLEPDANIENEITIGASDVTNAKNELKDWLDSIEY